MRYWPLEDCGVCVCVCLCFCARHRKKKRVNGRLLLVLSVLSSFSCWPVLQLTVSFNVSCFSLVIFSPSSLLSSSFFFFFLSLFLTNDLTHLGHPFPTLRCNVFFSLLVVVAVVSHTFSLAVLFLFHIRFLWRLKWCGSVFSNNSSVFFGAYIFFLCSVATADFHFLSGTIL